MLQERCAHRKVRRALRFAVSGEVTLRNVPVLGVNGAAESGTCTHLVIVASSVATGNELRSDG